MTPMGVMTGLPSPATPSSPAPKQTAHLSCPPGQRYVAGAQGIITDPATLLELERWRGVNVADSTAKHCQQEHDGELVAGPGVQQR
jgi:hypothetical protein